MDIHRTVVAAILALASPAAFAQAFRMTDLDLRDPHVFVDFIGCVDFTDGGIAGVSFNQLVANEISGDADGDGSLDFSIVAQFLPLEPSQPTNLVAVGLASCTAPASTTSCGPPAVSPLSGDAAIQTAGTCLAPLAGTLHEPYTPEIATPGPTCFRSVTGDVFLTLGGIPIRLQQAAIGATFEGAPIDGLANGVLRGFVSEADADQTSIPDSFPIVGGDPLSSVLPGGTGNCRSQVQDDRDTIDGSPGGTRGWWFYLNFAATEVVVVDPFADGFRDSFEDPAP